MSSVRTHRADINTIRERLANVHPVGEALQRAIESKKPLPPELLAKVQQELDRSSELPPENLKSLLGDRLVFHPDLHNETLALYKQYIVPNSVEVIAHANGHTSIRVGPTWFDFRGRAPDFKVMDKNEENLNDARRLKSVLALHKNVDARGMEPSQLGISVMYFLPRHELHKVWTAFRQKPSEIPWDGTGKAGENCISLSTSVLEQHAPQLGVQRTLGAEFFVEALQQGSKAAIVGCYTPDSISPFEFVASLVARKDTPDDRFEELMSFVPPRLQPAIDAARHGQRGVMPTFQGEAKPLVAPHSKVRLALDGSLFALQIEAKKKLKSLL